MFEELLFNSHTSDPLVSATKAFVRLMKINITPGEIEKALLSNPHYPSLAALTDLLNFHGVENLALTTTLEHLPKMEFPALAHVRGNGGTFVVLKGIEQKNIIYLAGDNTWRKETLEQFGNRWTGAILMAIARGESGDIDYAIKKRQEILSEMKRPVLLLLLAILTIGGSILSHSYSISAALILLITGCVITAVLGASEFSKKPLANKFCKENTATDCKAVLVSPAGKFLGVIPMTSIGFLYFAGLYFSLLIGIVSGHVPVSQIAWLSLLALPYTVFSIYYQYAVVKKWCTLCLAIQGIIVLLAILLATNYAPLSLKDTDGKFLMVLLLGFSGPMIYLLSGAPVSSTSDEMIQTQRRLAVWTRDPDLFKFVIQKERYVEIIPFPQEIVFGNPEASNSIVLVINWNCKPCERVLKEMLKVYHLLSEHVKIMIRFSFDKEDKASVHVINQLLLLNLIGAEAVLKALIDLTNLPLKKWMLNYNLPAVPSLSEQRQYHVEWCLNTGIHVTPTVFVNGYQLPERYTIHDLPYVLQETEQIMQPL